MFRLFGICLALLATSFSVSAKEGITIEPIRLKLLSSDRAVSMHVGNHTDQWRSFQVSARRWVQINGEDKYLEASEILLSPPVFRLAPGDTQLLRAGFAPRHIPNNDEEAYRIFVQEVPDSDSTKPDGLQLLMRFSVPLFAQQAKVPGAPLAPDWSLVGRDGTSSKLHLRNPDSRHIRIDQLKVEDASGELLTLDHLAYVLPGQSRSWSLPSGLQLPLKVSAKSSVGSLDAELPHH